MTAGGGEQAMRLSSPEFDNFDQIPAKFTCDGDNVNPTLEISDVPQKTQSLILMVEDPDAPRGTFVHWVMFNIDPMTDRIPEGDAPADAVESVTSTGKRGYFGPCPPSGTHRYFFKLYALDTALDLPTYTTADALLKRVKKHIIESTELVGLYTRT
jgi:Raf kinase inhibitor-like YbhB/YbcL family protein